MESQISNIITILTSLLTGGVLMILIENLHLSNVITDRFYNKMKPFECRFKSYISFVQLMRSRMSFKKNEIEYTETLENLINKISKIEKDSHLFKLFSAKELDNICCNDINGIWYYLSEKSQYVRPYIDFVDNPVYSITDYRDVLNDISPKYAKCEINLDTLMNISGDFYTKIYSPVSIAFFEYERHKERMKDTNTINFIYIIAVILSLLFIAFWGLSNIWISYILTITLSLYFIRIIYKFMNIYKDSLDKLL